MVSASLLIHLSHLCTLNRNRGWHCSVGRVFSFQTAEDKVLPQAHEGLHCLWSGHQVSLLACVCSCSESLTPAPLGEGTLSLTPTQCVRASEGEKPCCAHSLKGEGTPFLLPVVKLLHSESLGGDSSRGTNALRHFDLIFLSWLQRALWWESPLENRVFSCFTPNSCLL